ncbi:MAG: alpha-galactosidase [Planctomycetes bacterium]|nr:alpha-galactosidase [Planctomycetota bacterium]
MSDLLRWEHERLIIVIEIADDRAVRLAHCSIMPFEPATPGAAAQGRRPLVEVQATGQNQQDHHGSKYTGTGPGNRLRYVAHREQLSADGRHLEIEQQADGVTVVSHLVLMNGLPVVRSWTEVINRSDAAVGLEYVSSFALSGLGKDGLQPVDQRLRLHLAHNTWHGEGKWRALALSDCGLELMVAQPLNRIAFTSTGTWSTSSYLGCGALENVEVGEILLWQIEHQSSWHAEYGFQDAQLYLRLSGPTQNESHWWKELAPGEAFASVPVAVGVVAGGLDQALQCLTRYRRAIRRPNRDNRELPVIFNDYMNCLFGDPTTAALLPLIDAAAEVGCEYFCIDCGWYADGSWWDGVGEWLPSAKRFPTGIEVPLQRIRDRGMVPGLWLELEVMGINCALAQKVPDDWFFLRHGKRIIDHTRYQLDFRNPAVRAHADAVIDRVVGAYGVGYIKMDYNINAGIGTEHDADSAGDGLLEHCRAYLAWLDAVFARHPDLVVENCSSGGMRMDYALLSRQSIASTSDQTDYRTNALIACAAPAAATPEQCAVWAYPLKDGDREEVVFNQVNAMLMRIHQSGHLAELSAERRALVAEGIACYKRIRHHIRDAVPLWPLGMPRFGDGWTCLGLSHGQTTLLAVWRLGSDDDWCTLPVPHVTGDAPAIACIYPSFVDCSWRWNAAARTLSVRMPERYRARVFEIG